MTDRRSRAVPGKLVPGQRVPGKLVRAKLAAAVAMAIALAVPAPQAAADGVTGQVVGPDAKPVAGADVSLFSSWQPHADQVYESRSDEAGRFRIDLGGDNRMPLGAQVLVRKAGLAIGASSVPFAQRDAPLTIRLDRAATVSVHVVDPAGKPVAVRRAWLGYVQIGSAYTNFDSQNGSSAPRLPIELNDRGEGSINFLPANSGFGIYVESESFGGQIGHFSGSADGADAKKVTLRLRPTGAVRGQLVADAPQATARRELTLTTNTGFAYLKTNESGRFEVPALAEGDVNFYLPIKSDTKSFLKPGGERPKLVAGQTLNLRLELVPGVTVTGKVVDDATAAPIAGAEVVVHGYSVLTNRHGVYEALAGRGKVMVQLQRLPGDYMRSMQNSMSIVDTADGKAQVEGPTFRVKQGTMLAGHVVDEEARPVENARVRGTWMVSEGGVFHSESEETTSRPDGTFRLGPVSRDAQVGLAALSADRATAAMVSVPPATSQPVKLVIRPEGAVVLEGRIVDAEGKPVTGAEIAVVHGPRPPGRDEAMMWNRYQFPGHGPMVSDNTGAFRTPTRVARDERYYLLITAAGMLDYHSPYLKLNQATHPFRLPDIVLRRERRVQGRIVDAEGTPVAGAKVWGQAPPASRHAAQAAEMVTSADGRFELRGLHPDAIFVFAEKQGCALRGAVIPAKPDDVQIVLALRDKGLPPAMKGVTWPRQRRQQLLKDLILPIYRELLKEEGHHFAADALKRLAPFEREFCLGEVEKIHDKNRGDVLIALGELDEALESAARIKDPSTRAYQFLAAADATADAARKRKILADAAIHARQEDAPDHRVVALSGVARRLDMLGDREPARKLLAEMQPTVGKLAKTDWPAFARGFFAERLAPFDAAAAVELIKPLPPDERTRHFGNMAHNLAGVNPAEAERILNELSDYSRASYAIRVCYRMAPVDRERAQRIAEQINANSRAGYVLPESRECRAQAYGAMAMALLAKDGPAARRLLGQARDELRQVRTRDAWSARRAFPIAALLVGYAETVDPEHVYDYLWEALAMHPGPNAEPSRLDRESQLREDETIAYLALLLATFEQLPDLQKNLMEPIFRRWETFEPEKGTPWYRQNATFRAMALSDPDRTIKWHRAFHAKVSKDQRRYIPQAWQTVADAFGLSGQEFHKHVATEVWHLWAIDKEDL